MKQPGFMIYAEDWEVYTEDYSDEELGEMLRALLLYFGKSEQTTFTDRGMRQFYKLATKSIDLDIMRYEDKCLKNAYKRYQGLCKERHVKALSFEAWQENPEQAKQQLTAVDSGQAESPTQTPTINTQKSTFNNQPSTIRNQKSTLSRNTNRGAGFGPAPWSPLSEDEFEKRRERALASLEAATRCINKTCASG